jgi:hypothetical protein
MCGMETPLSTLNTTIGREVRVKLERTLDIILVMGGHGWEKSGSENVGFYSMISSR